MPYNSLKMTHTDGTMHHLGINESHVAKKVILVPNPEDVPILAKELENADFMGDYREYVTYTGRFEGEPITVMSCGFGCMPMAIAVEELKHLGVEEIIKIDACAAIDEKLKIGDIVACKGAVRGDGVTKEYIDGSYPAYPDMKLLFTLMQNGEEPVYFRSHDCLNNESPYAEGGQERMRRWSKLGVKVMDSETSALYVIGTILKLKVASSAVIKENYMTNQMMTEQQRLEALKKLFIKSCEIFCCQG
ncbi:MAG: hypothetical protein V8T10_01380 [Merdibacter sp.]